MVLVPAAIIILWPVFKGLKDLFSFGGSILSIPKNFVDWMNMDFDQTMSDLIYDTMLKTFKKENYDPSDPQQYETMQQLKKPSKMLSESQRNVLIKTWMKKKYSGSGNSFKTLNSFGSGLAGKVIKGGISQIGMNVKKKDPATLFAIAIIIVTILFMLNKKK